MCCWLRFACGLSLCALLVARCLLRVVCFLSRAACWFAFKCLCLCGVECSLLVVGCLVVVLG